MKNFFFILILLLIVGMAIAPFVEMTIFYFDNREDCCSFACSNLSERREPTYFKSLPETGCKP